MTSTEAINWLNNNGGKVRLGVYKNIPILTISAKDFFSSFALDAEDTRPTLNGCVIPAIDSIKKESMK